MPWCSHCQEDCPTVRDDDSGYICCEGCGKVLHQDIYYSGVTFEKTSGGESRMAGAYLNSVQSEYSVSHERTLMKGRDEIRDIVNNLSVGGGDSIINQAHRFYEIAVQRNFTRGRRIAQVAAACIYIACRQNMQPFLLIDFSDYLQINVYVLGAVFLQLCELLRLTEHPIVQKPIDPSLFIHRFVECLLQQNRDTFSHLSKEKKKVENTAMRIIASMKRDWMQTGRKPSGLCGAALYISALSHGHKYSKSDIVNVVHICEGTLTKRLIEFENTESGSLTIAEFLEKTSDLEGEFQPSQLPNVGSKTSGVMEMLCEHKDKESCEHFAHGLCRTCYNDFIKISGGLQGGSEPPAFQRAERQRMEKAVVDEKGEKGAQFSPKDISKDYVSLSSKDHESSGAATGHQFFDEFVGDQSHEHENMGRIADDEPESLSDIDDVEVDGYLHNEKEKQYKKIIWEEMNREYLEEQAAKEAAAAAAKEAYDANFTEYSEDIQSAQELAAAAAAAVAKSRKERKQKRAEEDRNSAPAQSAAEATRRMLKRKTFSSKINYEVLNTLYTSDQEKGKKNGAEISTGDDDGEQQHSSKKNDKTFDSTEVVDGDDVPVDISLEDDYAGEDYDDDYNYGNEDGEEFDFF